MRHIGWRLHAGRRAARVWNSSIVIISFLRVPPSRMLHCVLRHDSIHAAEGLFNRNVLLCSVAGGKENTEFCPGCHGSQRQVRPNLPGNRQGRASVVVWRALRALQFYFGVA